MGASKKRPRARKRRFSWTRALVSVAVIAIPPVLAATALAGWLELERIEVTVDEKFSGKRWDFPSKIYTSAYAVYPGLRLDSEAFRSRLLRLGYHAVATAPEQRGDFRFLQEEARFEIRLNRFEYPGRVENGRLVHVELDAQGRAVRILDGGDSGEIYEFLIEPGEIGGIGGESPEQRRVMGLDEHPVALVRAVLAVEDKRFFDHAGVDPRAVARAAVANVRAGGLRQGGSTLTQQLMKNFFLSSDRTLRRKVHEASMALVTERRYSKAEILENYLNEIYMGQHGAVAVHGMWEASRHYFGREPADLTLAQTATLAAIIRAPSYYAPNRHPQRAQQRRDLVLGLMYEQGDFDENAYRAALDEPMVTAGAPVLDIGAPYFVDHVQRELLQRYPRGVLDSEGYRIFTTLDAELQEIAETVVSENLAEIEADIPEAMAKAGQRLQAALVAVNPRTGAIRALVGGRDYGDSQFNRAIDMKRQPGSTFKPIVMLAALGGEQVGAAHFRPTSTVVDEKLVWRYENQVWSPSNYEDKFYGEVTLRDALEHSLNSATARIAKDVGIVPIRDLAVRLGMDAKLQAFPAIVLGGWAVPPIELAQVFSVFANGGMRASLMSVGKVSDRHGELVEGNPVEVQRAVPATDAYLVTHLLAGVMERGTGAAARRKGFRHPAAGKTGTSNDYKDAWFAGFTPDLLVIVWVGFDRAASMGLAGSEAALPIWTDFMRRAMADHPHTSFPVPPGIVLVDVDKKGGDAARAGCPAVIREAFLAGEEPSRFCGLHGGL